MSQRVQFATHGAVQRATQGMQALEPYSGSRNDVCTDYVRECKLNKALNKLKELSSFFKFDKLETAHYTSILRYGRKEQLVAFIEIASTLDSKAKFIKWMSESYPQK